MPIEIRGPDGSTNRFPDGTPDEAIITAMREAYGGPGQPGRIWSAPQQPSPEALPPGFTIDTPTTGLPPGFVLDDPTGLPPGFVIDAPAGKGADAGKKPAEARAYNPTWRDRTAGALDAVVARVLGEDPDGRPSRVRQRLVEGIVGSSGLGTTNVSLVDLTPAGIPMAVQEGQRAAESGDWGQAALGSLAVIPGARPAAAALGEAAPSLSKTLKSFVPGTAASVERKAAGVEREAAGKVRTAAQADLGSATPQEAAATMQARIAQAQETGQELRLVDAGEQTRALEREAANISPTGRAGLQEFTQSRYEAQAVRMVDWLRKATNNPQEAHRTLEAIQEAARDANSKAYAAAYKAGAEGILTPQLEAMTKSDAFKKAIAYADRQISNRTPLGREVPPTGPFTRQTITTTRQPDQLKSMSPAARAALTETTSSTFIKPPTLEYWDQVKRHLDDQISTLERQGAYGQARDIKAERQALLATLDKAVPKYAVARGLAAKAFQAGDAVEAGQKVARGTYTADEIKAGLAKVTKGTARMKSDELARFQAGFLHEYLKALSFTGERRDMSKILANSQGERAKLAAVLGPKTAEQMEAVLHTEKVMDLARTTLGNSTTTRQLIEAARFGSSKGMLDTIGPHALVAGGLAAATGNMHMLLAGVLTYGAHQMYTARAAGQTLRAEKVAEKVAEMLLSKDPSIYAKGVKELAGNPRMLSNLRDTVRALTVRVGGEETERRLRNTPRTRGLPGEITTGLGEASPLQ